MVKLLLAILAASFSIGLSQREIPKGYQFKCQPKDGSGMLVVFQDWSKLIKPDEYVKMINFDSLRKATVIFNASLSSLKEVQDSDEYKNLANYTCSRAYLDLDFYVENAIAFYQFLLKGFQAAPPTLIPDYKNQEDFSNLTSLLFNKEREDSLTKIAIEHAKTDKYVEESGEALSSKEFEHLLENVSPKFRDALDSFLIPEREFFRFTQFYAATFWKDASSSASFLSLPTFFYGLCSFYIARILQLLPFKVRV